MESELELTILMPCLNEAQTLVACIRQARQFLDRSGIRGEIVVADNGSTDGSQLMAEQAGARVVLVPCRGYGSALMGGIRAARGRYVIMGDADESYDFTNLDLFVSRLRQGDQLVIGNRFEGGIADGAMPWHHRYVGNPVLSYVGRRLFRLGVRDFHCGLRGFDRSAILSIGLESWGMEFASEMIVKASLHGLRLAEVPTTLSKDGRNRPPHLRSFRDGWRHLRFLLLHCPRWLFLYPGIVLVVLGLAVQLSVYFGPLAVSPLHLDVHSMLYGAASLFLGTQILVYWILSQFVAFRNGVLPQLNPFVARLATAPLEYGLAIGIVLFSTGVAWAGYETYAWAASGFGSLNPIHSMRSMIPSVSLMVAGGELVGATFFLSIASLGQTAASQERRASVGGMEVKECQQSLKLAPAQSVH